MEEKNEANCGANWPGKNAWSGATVSYSAPSVLRQQRANLRIKRSVCSLLMANSLPGTKGKGDPSISKSLVFCGECCAWESWYGCVYSYRSCFFLFSTFISVFLLFFCPHQSVYGVCNIKRCLSSFMKCSHQSTCHSSFAETNVCPRCSDTSLAHWIFLFWCQSGCFSKGFFPSRFCKLCGMSKGLKVTLGSHFHLYMPFWHSSVKM